MSFRGMIEDVAVADVMQLIRLGGHSGTLTVNNRQRGGLRRLRARPHRERVESALAAGGRAAGGGRRVDEGTLVRALEAQNAERPRRTIGQILVRMGSTTSEAIRDVMALEIERVVGEILSWKTGTFEFAIDDLTPMVEVTRFTGAPKVDLDTQTVLMDVLRRMEEDRTSGEFAAAAAASAEAAGAKNQSSHTQQRIRTSFAGRGDQVARLGCPRRESARNDTSERSGASPTPPPEVERLRFQIVSPDAELLARLNHLMAASGDRFSRSPCAMRAPRLLGESPPIVVVDLRYQVHALTTLSALCRSRPRAAVIALFEGRAPLREMYKSGVLSVTSAVPETVVACMQSAPGSASTWPTSTPSRKAFAPASRACAGSSPICARACLAPRCPRI
jgi:hypothetical protein